MLYFESDMEHTNGNSDVISQHGLLLSSLFQGPIPFLIASHTLPSLGSSDFKEVTLGWEEGRSISKKWNKPWLLIHSNPIWAGAVLHC